MKIFKKAILFQNGGIGDFLMALFLAEQLKEHGVTEKFYIVVHKEVGFLRGFMGEYPYISRLEISPRRPASLFSLFALFGKKNLMIYQKSLQILFYSLLTMKTFGFCNRSFKG